MSTRCLRVGMTLADFLIYAKNTKDILHLFQKDSFHYMQIDIDFFTLLSSRNVFEKF